MSKHTPTLAFALVLFALPIALSAALGNPEKGKYQPVQGLENWDTRLELEGLKQGKYNLIVRASDQAGNVRYEGPFNIFVDPESDLPQARVSCILRTSAEAPRRARSPGRPPGRP